MLPKLLVVGVLNFTLPSHEAAGCGEALTPVTDLDSTYLYKQDIGWPRIIKRHGVRGQEGQPHSFTFDCAGTCQYYVTTKDVVGNESCISDIVQVGGAVDVPPSAPYTPTATWYDVAGRKVSARPPPGVYLDHRGHRKIVLQ